MNAPLPDFWFRDPWYFLAALIVLLLPGMAVQSWLRKDTGDDSTLQGDFISWLADTVALSIALTALVALWFWFARIRLSELAIAALYGLCLLAIFAALLKRDLRLPDRARLLAGLRNGLLALLLVIILVAWRFFQARDLALPAWVDSVHHTLQVRVILEQGGLPRDYLPYIPAPAYYHYGFHLIAALHAFWAGITPDRAVLWFGQFLNAVVALSVYRAAYSFRAAQTTDTDDLRFAPRAVASLVALIAALLVGFAFHMPAYYLSWGRYTLLTGLILLGPACSAAFALWQRPHGARAKAAGVRLALLIAGMCAVHYLALLLLALFVVALGIFALVQAVRERNPGVLLRLVGWSLLGLVLAMPWLVWVFHYTWRIAGLDLTYVANQTEATQQRIADLIEYYWYLLGPRHNHFLMGFSAAGLLAAVRKPALRPLALWTALLSLLSLPWALRLGPFRPDHYIIILFFPASILLAELFVQSIGALIRVFSARGEHHAPREPLVHEAAMALLVLVVGGLLVWGGRQTRSVANPVTIIATQADVQALDWVKGNTPNAARFFINATRWQAIYRGVDGGYWLEPYTGRYSLIPPTFYSLGERDYIAQIHSWAERSESIDGCDPAFWEIVDEASLTHVYLREGVGKVQPAAMQSCPGIRQIYGRAGVFIYEIDKR